MKLSVRRALGCLGTVCLLLLTLRGLGGVLRDKGSEEKYSPFLAQEQDFDVLFLGTSHMIHAVDPMKLWEQYGIVSYNLGGHGNPLPLTYWVLRCALEHTTPKVVVIDCYQLGFPAKVNYRFEYTHLALDVFPLSLTKIAAARDLTTPPAGVDVPPTEHTALELLWDLSLYHTRWENLERRDFAPDYTRMKGCDVRSGVTVPERLISLPREDKLTEDTTGLAYLERAIGECQARGIQVLLTYLPFPAGESEWREANRVYDVAEKYGVPYFNYLTWDGIDYATDCCDENSHLNPSGARKVSAHIGAYLKQNFDLPDRRGDSAYAAWNEDDRLYQQYMDELLENEGDLARHLTLALDPHYDLLLFLEDPDLLADATYAGFLAQLGLDAGTLRAPVLIVRPGGAAAQALPLTELSGTVATPFGEVTLDGQRVSLNGVEYLSPLPEGDQVCLRLIDGKADTHTVLCAMNFDRLTRTLQ